MKAKKKKVSSIVLHVSYDLFNSKNRCYIYTLHRVNTITNSVKYKMFLVFVLYRFLWPAIFQNCEGSSLKGILMISISSMGEKKQTKKPTKHVKIKNNYLFIVFCLFYCKKQLYLWFCK